MSAKLASGVTVFAAYGVLLGVVFANGCSSTSGVRDAGAGSTDTNSSTGTGTATTGTGTGTATTNTSTGTSTTSTSTSTEADAAVTCGCPSTPPTSGLLYNGGIPVGTCPQQFTFAGVTNSWFGYNDGTSDSGMFVHTAQEPGCAGPNSCAFYASGSGYTGYGAGVGFTLNNNSIYDASSYTGLMVYMMGTTQGTRSNNFSQADNTVHVKFVTALQDGGDPREGDDYGAYCPLSQDAGAGCFTLCQLPFAGLTRDGFRGVDSGAPNPATDMFDPQNLVKIQFEFSLYQASDASVPNPVSFNVVIGYVSFY